MSDSLPVDLSAALAAAADRVGRFGRVTYRSDVESTNDVAMSLAMAGEPEGAVVIADVQRAGRGRRGRDWHSPAGAGLYLSAVVRPRGPLGAVPLVTLAAGAAAAHAVQAVTALPLELKWPNDLVIGRPWRKLGGVLCEAAGHGGRIDAVIVGLGINVRQAAYPREIAERATSIEAELGRPVERAPLLVALLESLRLLVDRLHAQEHEAICAAWRRFARAALSGAVVRWTERGCERRGRSRDIDRDGALLVESEGRVERLIAGEVQWEGLSRE
jgi:BirA family transcriptional regulator, biotin operon repressor / biotin---[acetyl-CoA-carboxylase] ligase